MKNINKDNELHATKRAFHWPVYLARRGKMRYVEPMHRFRILVTFLLCLTVPVAGWASVLGGLVQTHSHGHVESAISVTHHDHDHTAAVHIDHVAVVHSDHHKHDADCGKTANNHHPCKTCKCGCGVGACSPSSLTLLFPLPMSFKQYVGKELFPQADSLVRVPTHGSSPLRPPIA